MERLQFIIPMLLLTLIINLNSVKVTENRYFVALNSWWQMCRRGAVGRKSGWKMWGGEGA